MLGFLPERYVCGLVYGDAYALLATEALHVVYGPPEKVYILRFWEVVSEATWPTDVTRFI